MSTVFPLLVIVILVIPAQASFINLASVPCGLSKVASRTPKVIGGRPAQPGQFPWTASLRKRGRGGRGHEHNCAGSLVSSRHLVTAAHCVYRTSEADWEVVLGEHRPHSVDQGEQVVKIEHILAHPDYDDNPSDPNFRADIALIKLAEDAVWSDTIGPVCLPGINETVAKKDAIIAGWGNTGPAKKGGRPSKVLMFAALPIISNTDCKQWYLDLGNWETDFKASQVSIIKF